MKVKEIGAKVKKTAAAVLLAAMLHNAPLLAETPPNCTPFKKIEIENGEVSKYRNIAFENREKFSIEKKEDIFKILEKMVYAKVDKERKCYIFVTKNECYGSCTIEPKEEYIRLPPKLLKENTDKLKLLSINSRISFEIEGEIERIFNNPHENEDLKLFILTNKKLYLVFITKKSNNSEEYEIDGTYTTLDEISKDINSEKIGFCSKGSKYYLYDEEKKIMFHLWDSLTEK